MARKAAPADPMPMPIFAPVSRPLLAAAGVAVALGVSEFEVEDDVEVGVVVAVAIAVAPVLVAGSTIDVHHQQLIPTLRLQQMLRLLVSLPGAVTGHSPTWRVPNSTQPDELVLVTYSRSPM